MIKSFQQQKACLILIVMIFFGKVEGASLFVHGVGEKFIEPNLLILNVEIWSKASTAQQAQKLLSQQQKSFKSNLESFKIKKEDVQTQQHSLNPEYIFSKNQETPQISHYKATQNISITVRKKEEGGSLLDALISSPGKSKEVGLNIQSLSWDSDEISSVEISLLQDAVKNARKRAEEMALASGLKIQKVLRLSDTSLQSSTPMASYRESFKMAMVRDAVASPSTELSGGRLKVRVEVDAEYEAL